MHFKMNVFTPFLLFVLTIALIDNEGKASGISDTKARVDEAGKTDAPSFRDVLTKDQGIVLLQSKAMFFHINGLVKF